MASGSPLRRTGWSHALERTTPTGPRTSKSRDHRRSMQRINAKLRSKIVPAPAERARETSSEGSHAQGTPPRMSWARLLKRVFDIDVEHCPNCGGALKIIAAIDDPPVIAKILTHLGLPSPPPPRARRVESI